MTRIRQPEQQATDGQANWEQTTGEQATVEQASSATSNQFAVLYHRICGSTIRMNFAMNLNAMTQMKEATACDSNNIDAAINASVFSRLETREQVSVRSTQSCWHRIGKLRSITSQSSATIPVAQVCQRTWSVFVCCVAGIA